MGKIDTTNDWWRLKKHHNSNRVDMYSKPSVTEIIYRDEWHKTRRSNNYNRTKQNNEALYLYIVLSIVIVSYIVFKLGIV
jgi:hypothetical protein